MYRILCFGDSNTWGYNSIESDDDREVSFYNGYRDVDMIASSSNPIDLLIVMLGTNDLKRYTDRSAQKVAVGVEAVMERFVNCLRGTTSKNAKFLLVSPIEITKDRDDCIHREFDEASMEASRQLPGILQEKATRHNWHYFSASSVAEPGKADGLHLDGEAHKKLGCALAAYIKDNIL